MDSGLQETECWPWHKIFSMRALGQPNVCSWWDHRLQECDGLQESQPDRGNRWMSLRVVTQPKPIGNIQQLFFQAEAKKIGYFRHFYLFALFHKRRHVEISWMASDIAKKLLARL